MRYRAFVLLVCASAAILVLLQIATAVGELEPCNSMQPPKAEWCGHGSWCPGGLTWPDPDCRGIAIIHHNVVKDCTDGTSSQRCETGGEVVCTESWNCGWVDIVVMYVCFPQSPALDKDGNPVKSYIDTSYAESCIEA